MNTGLLTFSHKVLIPRKGERAAYAEEPNKKPLLKQGLDVEESGRGDMIRTCDSYVPNVVLYQAELRPDLGKTCRDKAVKPPFPATGS